MKNEKNYKVALGGICLALSVVDLYLASFVPGVELTLYAVSSIFVCIMISETGIKGGLMLYVAATILGFLLMPGKLGILPYIFFFGIYPIVKLFAEKSRSRVVTIIIKISAFLVIAFVGYNFFRELLFANIRLPQMLGWILAVGAVVGFILYDYILSGLLAIYRRKIKREKEIKLS